MSGREAHNHPTELLGGYAAGLTGAVEDDLVERHLLGCAQCLREQQHLASAAWSLIRCVDLPDPPPSPRPAGRMVRSRRRPRARPDAAPTGWARRPIRALAFAAAALVVVAGLGVGALLRPATAPSPPALTQLVASASDDSTGVSAVLVLTRRQDDVGVQVTVRGLQIGASYQLLLLARTGQAVVIAQWQATDATQVIRGTVPVPIEDVGVFAIGRPDGTILLAVPFGPTQLRASPSPSR